MLSGNKMNVCVCVFFLSMGTTVSQHLTSGLDTERRKKRAECVGEAKKKKSSRRCYERRGSSNILPAPSFSEQRGSSAFDI